MRLEKNTAYMCKCDVQATNIITILLVVMMMAALFIIQVEGTMGVAP